MGDDAKEAYGHEFNTCELAIPNCPQCKGEGYVGTWPHVELCPCAQLTQYRKAAKIRIESIFATGEQSMTLDRFDTGDLEENEMALRVAENYVGSWREASKEGWTVGFYGPPACGKTHLTTAIAIGLVERHLIRPLVLNVPKLLFNERQRIGDKKPGKSQVEAAMTAELLVLDDIGAEYQRDTGSDSVSWVQEMLYLILDERIRRGLPTLYTTNLSRDEMQAHMGAGTAGERLFSRIERAEVMPAIQVLPVAGKQKNLGAKSKLLRKA